MTGDDAPYFWVAYRMGAFESLGEPFDDRDALDGEAFAQAFDAHWTANYQVGLVLLAEVPEKGRIPVGVFFAAEVDPAAPLYASRAMLWFPWATPRNRLEAFVHLLDRLRADVTVLLRPERADERFVSVLARYAVVRPIGKAYEVRADQEETLLYQTRRLKRNSAWLPQP